MMDTHKARKFSAKQIRYLWAIGYLKTSPHYKGPETAKIALKTGKRQDKASVSDLIKAPRQPKPKVEKSLSASNESLGASTKKDFDPKDLQSIAEATRAKLSPHPYLNPQRVEDHFGHKDDWDRTHDYQFNLVHAAKESVMKDLYSLTGGPTDYKMTDFRPGGKHYSLLQPGERDWEGATRLSKDASDKWEKEQNIDAKVKIRVNEMMHSLDESEKKLQSVLDSHDVLTRMTAKGLAGVISSGRFKTQIETNTSKGYKDPTLRQKIDHHLFGFDRDGDPAKRPIYGYIGKRDGSQDEESGTDQYGDVIVSLKPSVRSRTTVTNGDSMDRNGSGRTSAMLPTPLTKVQITALTPQAVIAGVKGKFDVESNHVYKGKYRTATKPSDFTDYSYMEAQIHGGVKSTDIDHVTFTGDKPPSAALVAQLKKLGITYTIKGGG